MYAFAHPNVVFLAHAQIPTQISLYRSRGAEVAGNEEDVTETVERNYVSTRYLCCDADEQSV